MSSYVVEQLAAWCRRHPVRRKVLFVPSTQLGYNLTSTLARTGASWMNLEALTPEDEAARYAEPELLAAGWRRLPHEADVLLVEQIVPEVAREAGGYFSRAEWSSGLARAMVHTIRALRAAGVAPEELRKQMPRAKGGVMARCYEAYNELLEYEKLYDSARVLRAALEAEAHDRAAAFAILDETELSHLAWRYVQKAAGGDIYRIGRDGYVQPPPAQSAAARFSERPHPPEAPAPKPAPGARRLAGEELSPEDAAQIRLREAQGPENEVRAALRDLLDEGIPLDQVEIAYTSTSPYLTLLVEAADRFGLTGGDDIESRISFAEGVPAALTHPGQALLGWLAWIEQGFEARELVRLGRAGLLRFDEVEDLELSSQEMGQVLARARIGRGRANYEHAFERLRDELEKKLQEAEEKRRTPEPIQQELGRLEAVRQVMEDLLGLVPSGSSISQSAMMEACVRFLEKYSIARSARDRRERRSLIGRLEELGQCLTGAGSARKVATMLHELLDNHTGETAVAKSGKLYAVPLERAGYSGRPYLYILGMDEGAFPGNPTEDPILLDDERARFGERLALKRTQPGQTQWHLERVLGVAAGRVTLSASLYHLADGQERRPSPVFYRLGDSPERAGAIPAPERALTDTELLLALRRQEGLREVLEADYPWLAFGYRALRAREDAPLTNYDGILSAADEGLDPLGDSRPLSPSRLEVLARCPYRYFLRYVLRVEAPDDEEEPDPAAWLDPLRFGSLLHEVFAAFMERLKKRGERVDAERHEGELLELLEKQIDEMREQHPPPYEAAFDADRKRLRRAARVFLASEEGRTAEPVGFEVSFGFGREDGLHHPEPVEVELGEGLRFPLRGSIDRVDRAAGGYELWDYKTGSPAPYDDQDLLGDGHNLQWALYAYALEEILRLRGEKTPVACSGYVFTSERGHGRRIDQPVPLRQQLAERLGPLFEMARHGAFPHVHATGGSGNECRFCDFSGVCAEERLSRKADLKEVAAELDEEAAYAEALRTWMEG